MSDIFQHHLLETDILVAGGGPAGVAAALAAARQGAKVVLMQDRPVLGGNASSEVRMHILGANSGRPEIDLQMETRETGIIEEIRLENAFRNPQRSPSMFDQILYEKCVAEPTLSLYLDTRVTGARVENGTITEAEALCAATEDRYTVRAKVYLDCTGDGGLGVAAGAVFMRGREDKAEHGESFARDEKDNKTLGSTLLLMGRKHDEPMRFIAPSWARKFKEKDLKLRRHAAHGSTDYGLEYGFWWLEWGGHFDTIKDNAAIRHELLSIVMGIWDHIKNDGDHGAEYWALDWFGAVPGKRESRRFIGQHILTEADVLEARVHADAITYGGWSIDLHPPEGVDRPEEPPCTQIPVPLLYDVPLRVCVARDLSNLMFAGRNISATHVAFASTRIMATCATVGEGVGVAAAYAVEKGVAPASLACDGGAMHEIQQRLLRQDVFLINRPYEGEGDLAFSARITASSEQAEGAAKNVVSSQNRAIEGERGVQPEREVRGTHRWMSAPAASLPAWLELRWEEPVAVGEVEIIFDSGLHRTLTLSQSEGVYRNLIWGTGQLELVKSYRVEAEVAGRWVAVAEVAENWQRRASHGVEGNPCTALRITVEATWGLDHARIVQVRVREAGDRDPS